MSTQKKTQIQDLFLRFTYHLYVSHAIKYREYNELWECEFKTIPDRILSVLHQKEIDQFIEKEKETAYKNNTRIIDCEHPEYPSSLKNLKGMPPVLYCKGNCQRPFHNCIAIVGSRKASLYGKKHAYQFASELSMHGFMIVSGMAYGIDSQAHKGALDSNKSTVAVVANGTNVCYPTSHSKLKQSIEANGLILSEFPMSTTPRPYYFPARNRIISGLSDGLILIEAAIKSGAMITADLAIEQGKEVFSLPGSIDSPTSKGTNELLKQGVRPITETKDVLDVLGSSHKEIHSLSVDNLGLDDTEAVICKALENEDLDFSELSALSSIPIATLMKALTKLEVRGIIKKDRNKYCLLQRSLF